MELSCTHFSVSFYITIFTLVAVELYSYFWTLLLKILYALTLYEANNYIQFNVHVIYNG